MKPYIVDVHLCPPDQTYYPLTGRSKYTDFYPAHSVEELLQILESDGWKRCGMVRANDGRTVLQMFGKRPTAAERHLISGSFIDPEYHLIAIAEES